MKFPSKYKHFLPEKYISKCHLENVGHFIQTSTVLYNISMTQTFLNLIYYQSNFIKIFCLYSYLDTPDGSIVITWYAELCGIPNKGI